MVPKHWKYIVIVVSLFVTIFTLSAFPRQDPEAYVVTISPTTAGIGEEVRIILEGFSPGTHIEQGSLGHIKFGEINATVTDNMTIDAEGELSFYVRVPPNVRTGTSFVRIATDSIIDGFFSPVASAGANIFITGTSLTATPTAVVPNQTINLQGSGWTDGGAATINNPYDQSSISLDGSFDGLKNPGGRSVDLINAGNKSITIDNGGNWSAPVVIPMTNGTMSGAIQTLEVTDSGGRTGSVEITIASRRLSLTPAASGLGTTVSVEGSGYPAANSSTGAATVPTVTMTYYYGSSSKNVATFTPDGNGAFAGTFTVPLDAGIPSDNLVKSSFHYTPSGGFATAVINTVAHSVTSVTNVSGPQVAVNAIYSEETNMPQLDLTGEGFDPYTRVDEITINDTTKFRPIKLITDSNGNISGSVTIPELSELPSGEHKVSMRAGTKTARSTFTITEAIRPMLVTKPTPIPYYQRKGATPFPFLPKVGTPVPMPEQLTDGAYLTSIRNTGEPGFPMKLIGVNFPKIENITSVYFLPVDPPDVERFDITPLTKYFDFISLSNKYQYKRTNGDGMFNESITIPNTSPGLYYIEATVAGTPATSASMLFRVTGDQQIPTPTPPYPTSTPYPTYTPMPTYTPVPTYIPYPINIIPSPGIYTISSDVHDIYYGPNQICAEDL